MKKTLAIALAAVVLSACGSSVPDAVDTTTNNDRDELSLSIMRSAWDTQTPEQQYLICVEWEDHPQLVINLISSDGVVESDDVIKKHFDAECG